MREPLSLDALWESAPSRGSVFQPDQVEALPEPARRYLKHAIAPGTPLAAAVRLRMHGQFRRHNWFPFTAEQVIRGDAEMLWRATIRIHGLPVTGYDSVHAGEGRMEWKLLGLVPFVTATGADITRSALGRVEGEAIWLPSSLLHEEVAWRAADSEHATASFSLLGERTELTLALGAAGDVQSLHYQRWGNPEGEAFHYGSFGGYVEEERTFGGYTIPTRMRAGWYFGTDRFETEGEFFRVTVDNASFR